MSKASRRDSILSQVGVLAQEPATMPGSDGPVDILVREMTGTQGRQFEILLATNAPAPIGYLLQVSIVDPESNELIFEEADREALEQLGVAGLNPVLKIAQRMNGITQADIDKAKQSLLSAP
jgi:hypothetical protein